MKKTDQYKIIDKLLASRARLPYVRGAAKKADEEGGCGVTGFISSIPVRGRHIYEPSVQMHNRGNGKGGGIAAVGLSADDLGVPREVLADHYLLQIAYLDPESRPEVEAFGMTPFLDIHTGEKIPTIDDYRDIGLEVQPPDVWRYFVRVKENELARFIDENDFSALPVRKAEDEFIYQNTVRINQQFYSSLGEKKAFVLSHGRDVMILKVVGYAEQVAQYYCLENFRAHGWIAHQRYPTRGRLWHPGGAHPFSGMHEALVHNGDFANYHAVSEYLHQHNIYPQFLTDTEVSVLLFDLFSRTYGYPMEYVIEALAPTSEYDFDSLTREKQRTYRYIQSQHTSSSPDGPWFFIIARNDVDREAFQLIGITDTAMLRPQVFALQERPGVQIGLICSEKQAIDATLQSLADEDSRFCPIADKYWNARGGSATDGGAFLFTVRDSGKGDGTKELVTTNKFGEIVTVPQNQQHYDSSVELSIPAEMDSILSEIKKGLSEEGLTAFKTYCVQKMEHWDFATLSHLCDEIVKRARFDPDIVPAAIEILTHLNDRRYPTGSKRRSSVLHIIRDSLWELFESFPQLDENAGSVYSRIDRHTRDTLRNPQGNETVLVVNAREFEPEGKDCDSRLMNKAYRLGWKQFICYGYKGQRFTGCGFSQESDGVKIDVYDSSGDYLASGIDGMEIHVHGNAQDQLGQIMKRGKLVVHGDVGQTFMYGAKGGEVYVMGNAAGRPLINGTGHPRVVINGTCLDYLAESFMAGDPLNGGGFVILNGMMYDDENSLISQSTPYPGSNLFSLASGGAIYFRDPHRIVVEEQLNGGQFTELSPADWELIYPYLEENERLFGISIDEDLLSVDGVKKEYSQVFRKVQAVRLAALSSTVVPVNEEYLESWDETGTDA